jgi:hypothetical protein
VVSIGSLIWIEIKRYKVFDKVLLSIFDSIDKGEDNTSGPPDLPSIPSNSSGKADDATVSPCQLTLTLTVPEPVEIAVHRFDFWPLPYYFGAHSDRIPLYTGATR